MQVDMTYCCYAQISVCVWCTNAFTFLSHSLNDRCHWLPPSTNTPISLVQQWACIIMQHFKFKLQWLFRVQYFLYVAMIISLCANRSWLVCSEDWFNSKNDASKHLKWMNLPFWDIQYIQTPRLRILTDLRWDLLPRNKGHFSCYHCRGDIASPSTTILQRHLQHLCNFGHSPL